LHCTDNIQFIGANEREKILKHATLYIDKYTGLLVWQTKRKTEENWIDMIQKDFWKWV